MAKDTKNTGTTQSYSQEELDKAMALLERDKKHKEIQRKKRANMTEAEKEERKAKHLRSRVKRTILLRKAKEAGITVTDKEIEQETNK